MKTFLILWFIASAVTAIALINKPRRTYGPVIGTLAAASYVGLAIVIGVTL